MNTVCLGEAKTRSPISRHRRSWVPASAGMTSSVIALALLAACSGGTGPPYERGVAAFDGGRRPHRAGRVAQRAPGRSRRQRGAGACRRGSSSRSATASPPNPRSSAPARPASRPTETAHLLAHAKLLQGDARAALAEAAGAAPAHEAYAAAHPRPRLHGARRRRQRRAPRSTARSPSRRSDSDVWTDVARFRRANGDIAGALEAADRAVAAAPAQRRGAGAARRV